MVFHGFWLVYMVFNVVSWFFHGFWLVSMVFQGGLVDPPVGDVTFLHQRRSVGSPCWLRDVFAPKCT